MPMIRFACAAAMAGLSAAAAAVDFSLDDGVVGKFDATLTAGTMIRTESRDPAVLGALAPARVGLPPGQLGGNAGRNDLNFQRGRPVSTVVKGVFDLELKRGDVGAFVRARAWHDFELKDGDRAYGNSANGFRQNAPLSDSGFASAARFSNAQFADAYVFGKFGDGGRTLDLRAGRQVVNWGVAQFVTGGVDAVNPADYAARVRPGSLPQEGKLPVGMLYANLAGGKDWGAEGFVPYEFRPSVLAPCGTFFDTAYYAPPGCNYVSVLGGAGVNDAAAVAGGLYPKRSPDALARDGGQFGLSLRYAIAANTELRAYAMNYHNRMPSIRGTNPNVAGTYGSIAAPAFTRLTNANGLKYGLVYAEDIRLYGMSFDTRLDPATRVYGEVAYRPNQPINLNPSDLIAAFLTRSPTSALNLAKNTNAIPPGGTFDGYDRFGVASLAVGAGKAIAGVWGAERLTLNAELGWSHVSGLPDPGVLRYGRSDDYGVAAINGVACVDATAAKKSCAHDGFITPSAWGYRVRVAAVNVGQVAGATLTPSLAFAHDVSGYSYDGGFVKDRKVLRPGVRGDWGRRYWAEVQYARIWGGAYNTLVDRDNLTLVVGAAF